MICDAFTCTPTEALAQPWPLVQAVLEYRTLEQAIALMNAKGGMVELEKHPEMVALVLETHRAQFGTDSTIGQIAADHAPAEDA